MSFTSTVKNELSKLELEQIEKISLLSAVLKNSATIDKSIRISTENSSLAREVFTLIKELYSVSPKITVRKGYNYNKNLIYILEIKEKKDIIIKDLSLDKNVYGKFKRCTTNF